MEACPVFVEHVPKVIDLRRHLVMEEGKMPDTMQAAMRSMESQGHPYPGNTASRLDWCRDLDVNILADVGSAEYLYWVGCSTALNSRNQKTAQAFSKIMLEAGVDFAILRKRNSGEGGGEGVGLGGEAGAAFCGYSGGGFGGACGAWDCEVFGG